MAESSSTEPFGVSLSETKALFSCPSVSVFIWELDNATSHQMMIVVTSIACFLTVLLNLLVILAVKTRHELQKTSTMILLCSLAVADLLVGALSMPLSITLDALVLQKHLLVDDIFCTIDFVNVSLTYAACHVSFFHLLVIAWERYVAVNKWREYKAIVTSRRLRKYAIISWLVVVLGMTLSVILQLTGAHDEIILTLDIVGSLVVFLCLFLLGYLYGNVYRGIRKWNRSQFRQVNALIKWKREVDVALTTFLLTIFAGVSTLPTIAVLVFGTTLAPFFLRSSFFRWSDLLLQMNSLVNPIFYCYRNHQLRRAVLELLRIPRKPQRIQPKVRSAQLVQLTRHRDSVLSLDCGKYRERHRLERSQSCSALTYFDSTRGAQHVKPDEHCDSVASLEFGELKRLRSKSCSAVVNVDEIYTVCGDATQPFNQTVTVQIESAARMKAMQSNLE